jgi:hypothetical protein
MDAFSLQIQKKIQQTDIFHNHTGTPVTCYHLTVIAKAGIVEFKEDFKQLTKSSLKQ